MEVVAGFREYFSCSAYDVGKTISVSEGYYLLQALASRPDTLLYGKLEDIPAMSREMTMLTHIFNALIATSQAKTQVKKKVMIELPVPASRREAELKQKKMTAEEAKAFFAHVKVLEEEPANTEKEEDAVNA